MKAMDGVDFMLSMPNGKLDYLEDQDLLEALWLDVDPQTSKVNLYFFTFTLNFFTIFDYLLL